MSDSTQNKITSKQNEPEAYDFTTQEESDTAICMDVLKKQEAIARGTEINHRDEDCTKVNNINTVDTCIEIDQQDKLVIKQDTKDKEVNVPDDSDLTVKKSKNHSVLVNFFGNTPVPRHQNQFSNSNGPLWQQNVPPPPPQTWSNWIQGRPPPQVPDGYPGPLNYTPQSRNSFVRLVLSITFVMLVATACLLTYVWNTPEVKQFFQDASFAFLLLIVLGLIIIDYTMMCSPCARDLPCNFVLLTATVILMSALAAKISIRYNSMVILYAFISTSIVVFVCLILACTNYDFTQWALYVVVIATAFTAIAMLILITFLVTKTFMKVPVLIILSIGTLLQVIFLTMELQMILGGKTVELGEEDYALGAFMLYASIMDIFVKMLQLIGIGGDYS